MDFTHAAQRLLPTAVKGKVKQLIRSASPITATRIIDSLYSPLTFHPAGHNKLVWSRSATAARNPNDPIPIPTPDLRMGYDTDDDASFLESGQYTSDWLHRLINKYSMDLTRPCMEWGCATARVLRHFQPEARNTEFWGIDQAANHIAWCKENCSPPFKFMNCTAYPHLPFPDNHFSFIYGISVFTHLFHLIDTWLMEFRRILAPGGHAIFTIMDEHTLDYFRELPDHRPDWLDPEDISAGLTGDIMVFGGDDWGHSFTIFKDDWVRHEWSQYLDVVAIEPRSEAYQSAVILARR